MTIRLRKVLGGAQPPRARAMARKRKAAEAECRARKSPTRPYKPQRDLIGSSSLYCLHPAHAQVACQGVVRHLSKPPACTLHRTMTKVCKSHGEGTFAGTRGNGEVA